MKMSFLFQQTASNENDGEPLPTEKHQDLLIFGYHCKLFRDDSKASAIDSGDHLIPWMGNHSLKIDRYDGRGLLFDLRPFDADNMESRGELTSDEIRIERLCEEERYYELHNDIAEKALQEEEEIKRLNMELAESGGYQAVGFSYDQPSGSSSASNTAPNPNEEAHEEEEEDDHEFIPPDELCLPRAMAYPSGTKLNALIEKTAKFVSSHGGQMEIMIKTKQTNNPQFKFLNFEHFLNPYYKHQVYMIKHGKYNPDIHNKAPAPKPAPTKEDEESDDDDEDYSGYLHPSLLSKSTASQPASDTSSVAFPRYTESQLQDTAYGRLMKKMANKIPSVTNSPQRISTPTFSEADSNSQSAFTEHYQQQSALPSESVQSVAEEESAYGDVDSYTYDTSYYSQYYQSYQTNPPAPPPHDNSYRPASPPIDVKPLIERLITYVRKDGEAFEQQVLLRKDDRFSFLQPGDEHYNYYNWRKQTILAERMESGADGFKSKGVSFSIKQKEPEANSIDTSRAALPIDPESDDEQANQEQSQSTKDTAGYNSYPIQPQIASAPYQPEAPRLEDKPPPSDESLQKKLAEQKLRDKLAAAAREKMTQVTQNTKDKALQAERKRRAAMFVNMLKSKQKDAPPIGPELPSDHTHPSATASMSLESRLSSEQSNEQDHHPQHHTNRSRSRSPPSAYTVRVNRSRNSHSHRREQRHKRHRQPDDRPSHHRKRKSPSPSLIKQKREPRRSPILETEQLRRPPPSGANEYAPLSGSSTPHQEERSTDPSREDNNEFMLKVRKMLRESRQAVYKEDLFGN